MKLLNHINNLKKTLQFLPVIILITIMFLILSSGVYEYISIDNLKKYDLFLQQYVNENYILSVIIFFLSYFLVVAFSIPAATIMTLIGGFLFGQIVGTICIVLAASFGGCVIFLSSKLASKGNLEKNMGNWIGKLRQGFKDDSFSYMLTLRLIPIFPFVVINIAAGILQVPLKHFFFGTLFGIIPATFIYVSTGISMREILHTPNFSVNDLLDVRILFSLTGLGILAISPIVYKKLKRNS